MLFSDGFDELPPLPPPSVIGQEVAEFPAESRQFPTVE